jgi:hypothetical protein
VLAAIKKNAVLDPEIIAEKKDKRIIKDGIAKYHLKKIRCRNNMLDVSKKYQVSKINLF